MNPQPTSMLSRLTRHPFLAGMKPRHLEILALAATPARFAEAQSIFRLGEPADEFYLIEKGDVAQIGRAHV